MLFLTKVTILGLLCVGCVLTTHSEILYEKAQRLPLGLPSIESIINDTINDLLNSLPDPVVVDALALNFTQEMILGQASISNLKLSGIKTLVASYMKVKVLSMQLNATIVIPELTISTKYDADVTLAKLLPLYGKGRVGVTIENIELHLSGKVNVKKGIKIAGVALQLTLGNAGFDLHGLLNNDDLSTLVGEILNDNLVSLINDNKVVLGKIISPIAEQLINKIFEKKTKNLIELQEQLNSFYME